MVRLSTLFVLLCATFCAAAEPVASSRAASFGIGSIRWSSEGTDAAFEAFRFFRRTPVKQLGQPMKVSLVDLPTDADYELEGTLTGGVQSVLRPGAYPFILGATIFEGAVGLGALVGFLATHALPYLFLGLTVMPLFVVCAILTAGAAQIVNQLDGAVSGEFDLRKDGKKVAHFTVSPVQARGSFADEPPDPGRSRDALLQPLFTQLKIDIEGHLAKAAR